MKKFILSMLLALSMLMPMFACDCGGDDPNLVVIYTAAEEERITYLQQELNAKFPQYNIVFQSIGTGKLYTKLKNEGRDTDCDIFYDLEVAYAETILKANKNLFYSLDEYDFDVYEDPVREYTDRHKKYAVNGKTNGTIIVNTTLVNNIPATYDDLLKSEYKNLIAMPNPKTSGTGYAFYNGLVSSKGEEAALTYFNSLNSNIKEYTTSGSAPIKAVNKGEVAIGVGLLWQCVEYAKNNNKLEVVFLDDEVSYNLFTMGIISGKEAKKSVKDVFGYLFNELNLIQCEKFNPDKIYKNQGAADKYITGYPTTGFTEIAMQGLFNCDYKQNLLSKWTWSV